MKKGPFALKSRGWMQPIKAFPMFPLNGLLKNLYFKVKIWAFLKSPSFKVKIGAL